MKKRILFLINPISGVSNKKQLEKSIHKYIRKGVFEYDIHYTEYPGHGKELSLQAVKNQIDVVVVAGGDGSVNEVASAMVNTSVLLGIIPTGSGNGLARHLNIPRNIAKNFAAINTLVAKKIDTYSINNQFGCNLAGIGFDAYIAGEFAKSTKRGFFSYLGIILKSYQGFKPITCRIEYEEKSIIRRVLLLSIANSNQFGNGAVIAPQANIYDGKLDVCLLKKVPLLLSPFLGMALMGKWINKTSFIEYIRTNELIVFPEENAPIHIDGDPFWGGNKLHIKVNPLSLNVIGLHA